MSIRATLLVFTVVASLAGATGAMAYDETGRAFRPYDCAVCHGVDTVSVDATGVARTGPHGGYTATSRTCKACHYVHRALPEGVRLLPTATLTDTCEICHDGTGGNGVYGTIAARGLTVRSSHSTELTSAIPGGDASTGGTSTAVFTSTNQTLGCGDCHTPHGMNVVDPFTTDRARIETDTGGFFSSQLLKRYPTSATTETTLYGSDWCVGCHKGRDSGLHNVFNHPVESSGTASFTYENLQVVNGVNTSQTVSGTLGRSNFGYVMPFPRTSGQGTHKPICQQCHEDGRNVGGQTSGQISADEVFSVTGTDTATDSPRFQVFPHESAEAGLLIETGDDLCTNCHHTGQLK